MSQALGRPAASQAMPRRGGSKARELVAELFRRDRMLASTGAGMLVVAAICVALMPFDHRTVLGIDPWIKPFKFCVSVAIYLWTLAWFFPALRVAERTRRLLSVAFSLIMILEIGCIVLQSARGVRSHFNFATGFDAAVFNAMGGMIAVNTILLAIVLGSFFLRGADLRRSYLWAIRLGLLVTLLGSAEGGLMVAHRQHTVGVADGGPGLPLVNWSRDAGDLRVAHMIGLHGMQLIPLFAFLLGRATPAWPERRRTATVFAFCAIYVAVGGAMLAMALSGVPISAVV